MSEAALSRAAKIEARREANRERHKIAQAAKMAAIRSGELVVTKKQNPHNEMRILESEAQRRAFVLAYLSNGNSVRDAAIAAGYSAKTASSMGSKLLRHPRVLAILAECQSRVSALLSRIDQSIDATMLEVERIAKSDVRKLFDAEGNLIPLHMLDDDTAAAISGFEMDVSTTTVVKVVDGQPVTTTVVNRSYKPKFWDKVAALHKLLQISGKFDKDLRDKGGESLILEVIIEGEVSEEAKDGAT